MKQREIKFRAWVNDIQNDYDWRSKQCSSYDWWRMAEVLTIHINKNGARCRYVSEDNKPEVSDYEIGELCTIMQFTGLLDNNGKEIYEGDIITHEDAYGPCVIEYQTAEYVACDRQGMGYDLCAKCEVVGNIHENPELLK